jgi:acetylornithine deacetylase/succinyl-diaminopimelate desuccinylase-like protein
VRGEIERDVAALAAIERGSAGQGERAAAAHVVRRLEEAGLEEIAVEPYRWPRTYAWTHLLHALAGLGPRWLSMAAAVSYALECSGRLQWLPRLLPKGDGVNVVARIPPRDGGRVRRTLVLVAHLDTQRAGLMWSPAIVESGRAARIERRAMSPAPLPLLVGLALRLRPLALIAIAGLVDTARHRPVPGANDNASGVAAVLAAARRLVAEPLDGTEVLLVFPGAEEAGMGGMRAFLAEHEIDPATSFVLGLDTVGSGAPVVARAEGAVLGRYAERDLDVVDAGARRAGEGPLPRWRIAGWTDPILARHRGVPAASVLSVDPATGFYTRYHRPDDLPQHVDLESVARCARVAEGVAREISAPAASS